MEIELSQSSFKESQSWLPLTEYSNKYRVSLSTLRRRIKAQTIQHIFSEGKYFILDAPSVEYSPAVNTSPSQGFKSTSRPSQSNQVEVNQSVLPKEDLIGATHSLLGELKQAYAQVLQEKEQQIFQLKQEICDLKTLVKVLESQRTNYN